jgi:hypothetical protein
MGKKMHSEELHNLYFLPNIDDQVKEHEMGWTCSRDGGDEKYIQNYGWKA